MFLTLTMHSAELDSFEKAEIGRLFLEHLLWIIHNIYINM
jgi:hypothetical protein